MIKINNVVLAYPHYVLTDAGDIQIAQRRVAEDISIYGANGSYVMYDGAYESYERSFKFSVSDFNKVSYLRTVFKDLENEIEFDYLKGSKYYADLVGISYTIQGKSRWLVDVKLRFDPFRYSLDRGVIALAKSGTVNNIGDVFSEPIIEVVGNGEVSLTIGKQTMVLDLDTKAIIDCRHRKQNIYDKHDNVKNSIRRRGVFFEIPPGVNGVSTSGNVSSLKIFGNWRWLV